jgi:hypothetical protein
MPLPELFAQFPSDLADELITDRGIFPASPSPRKVFALHIFRLRRLQSEIQSRLYATSASCPPSEWFEDICQRLEVWHEASPKEGSNTFLSTLWFTLCYRLTLNQVNRPSPARPSPNEQSMLSCLESSAIIIDNYRKMRREGKVNNAWASVHHLFIVCALLGVVWLALARI